MILRLNRITRFCSFKYKSQQQKRILNENIINDRFRSWNNYKFTNSIKQIIVDNFKQNKDDAVYLDRCEIETRIMKRIHDSQIISLNDFDFDKDVRTDLQIDSLNLVVLMTEIQNQFTTVFQDKVFESFRKFNEIVDILVRDQKVF